jgi:hypothetical protein
MSVIGWWSQPVIAELEIWMRQQRALLSAKNDTAKAINYTSTAGQRSPASSTTAMSACRITPPNGPCAASLAQTPAGIAQQLSIR